VHFPDSIDPVFYEQLTSERLVTRMRKLGRAVRVWELIPGRRNEVLDCSSTRRRRLTLAARTSERKLAEIVQRVNEAGAAIKAGGAPAPNARPGGRRMFSRGIT
jgi:phage terminase large subunit GpA-like protein